MALTTRKTSVTTDLLESKPDQTLHSMDTASDLQATVQALVQKGKGILAADESNPTIAKRFKAIDV